MKGLFAIAFGLVAVAVWAEPRNVLVSEKDTPRLIKILGDVEGTVAPHPYMALIRAQNLNCVRSTEKCTFAVKGGSERSLENASELISILDRALETNNQEIKIPFVSCSVESVSKAMACWLVFK